MVRYEFSKLIRTSLPYYSPNAMKVAQPLDPWVYKRPPFLSSFSMCCRQTDIQDLFTVESQKR